MCIKEELQDLINQVKSLYNDFFTLVLYVLYILSYSSLSDLNKLQNINFHIIYCINNIIINNND